jgi:NADH-quinone oxidoreductase subunit D
MDTRERPAFQSSAVTSMVRGGGLDVEVVPSGELRTEEMILNIGPQHPSTHGVLRVVLELDGEVITRAEPVIGYMHRAAEKLAEHRDARQVLVLMNRHDWISAFNNELGWTIAVERLAEIEVPERARWIRTMFAEWNRILNHLMFTGSYPLELGAMTPIFYAFREREMIQDLLESATGARMHHSYCRVGGLKDDLPRGFVKRAIEVLADVRKRIAEFETLIMGNEILFARTRRGSRWTRARTSRTRSTARSSSRCRSVRTATATTGCGCSSSGSSRAATSSSNASTSSPPGSTEPRSCRRP